MARTALRRNASQRQSSRSLFWRTPGAGGRGRARSRNLTEVGPALGRQWNLRRPRGRWTRRPPATSNSALLRSSCHPSEMIHQPDNRGVWALKSFCNVSTPGGHPSAQTRSDNAFGVSLLRPCPALCHGCPVEGNRLFAAARDQLQIPLTGLVPVIHGFSAVHTASLRDVGGRTKSDQVRPRGTMVVSVITGTCPRLQ